MLGHAAPTRRDRAVGSEQEGFVAVVVPHVVVGPSQRTGDVDGVFAGQHDDSVARGKLNSVEAGLLVSAFVVEDPPPRATVSPPEFTILTVSPRASHEVMATTASPSVVEIEVVVVEVVVDVVGVTGATDDAGDALPSVSQVASISSSAATSSVS